MDYVLRGDILNDWFVEGVHRGARYMIVVFDLYETEEHPVFVFPEQDIQIEVVKQMNDSSLKLNGVVDLLGDAEHQISAINRPEKIHISRVVN